MRSRATTTSPTSGSLLVVPNNGTSTTITTGNQSTNSYLVGTFTSESGSTNSNFILGGIWTMYMYSVASDDISVSFYANIYYVSSSGTETLLVAGNPNNGVQVYSTPNLLPYSLYVPTTTLPDLTYNYRIKLYANFSTLSSVTDFNNATIIADNYSDMFSILKLNDEK